MQRIAFRNKPPPTPQPHQKKPKNKTKRYKQYVQCQNFECRIQNGFYSCDMISIL